MRVDQFRPNSLDEVIGQTHVVKALKGAAYAYKTKGEAVSHLIFEGPKGVGKTTCAFAFVRELGIRAIEYNAGDDRGANFVRDVIKPLTQSTMGVWLGGQILILEEADALTPEAQKMLNRIMEKSRYPIIFLVNDLSKIVDTVQSRCVIFHFNQLSVDDMINLVARVISLLNIRVEKEELGKVSVSLIDGANGDARVIFNILETVRHLEGELTLGIISQYLPKLTSLQDIDQMLGADLEQARIYLEEFVASGRDTTDLIRKLIELIIKMDINGTDKCKMLELTANAEANIKTNNSPYVQLLPLLAMVKATSQK